MTDLREGVGLALVHTLVLVLHRRPRLAVAAAPVPTLHPRHGHVTHGRVAAPCTSTALALVALHNSIRFDSVRFGSVRFANGIGIEIGIGIVGKQGSREVGK